MRVFIIILILSFSSCLAQSQYSYSPKSQLYEVSGNENPLKIRIKAVLLQRDDGSGNYSKSRPQEFKIFQKFWKNALNNFQNLKKPTNLDGCYTGFDFWPTALIEFEDEIIEVRNTYAWNSRNTGSDFEKNTIKGFTPSENWYLKALDDSLSASENNPAIHVYFTNDGQTYDRIIQSKGKDFGTVRGIAAGQFPSLTNFKRSSQIHFPGIYPKYIYMKNQAPIEFNKSWEEHIQYWYLVDDAKGLTHEIGHNLGLSHANEHHGINKCPWTIMSQKHTDARNYLQPTEIQKIHRNLSNSNLIQFVTPDSHYGKTMKILNHTEWNQKRRYYHDFEVNRNINLTVSNHIILPSNGKITLNRNSKLIFEKNGGIYFPDGSEFNNYQLKGNAKIIRN